MEYLTGAFHTDRFLVNKALFEVFFFFNLRNSDGVKR